MRPLEPSRDAKRNMGPSRDAKRMGRLFAPRDAMRSMALSHDARGIVGGLAMSSEGTSSSDFDCRWLAKVKLDGADLDILDLSNASHLGALMLCAHFKRDLLA